MTCVSAGWRKIRRGSLQLCTVLGSLSGTGGMQPAQVDLPALVIRHGASLCLPVGVLLGPGLPLSLFSPCQLSTREAHTFPRLRRAATVILSVLV